MALAQPWRARDYDYPVEADTLQVDFTKDLATQHAKHGIRCNIIVPRGKRLAELLLYISRADT